ncbi:hypothetical protein ABID25_006384 [Mesorhizobium abyssinicae]
MPRRHALVRSPRPATEDPHSMFFPSSTSIEMAVDQQKTQLSHHNRFIDHGTCSRYATPNTF